MKNLPIITENLNPVALFVEGGIDKILKKVEAEVLSVVPDLETGQGRKDIASLAHMVAKSKVALDSMGKDFVADKKAEIKKVDAQRKKSRDFLDNLKTKVRQPLTDYEEAEKARVEAELIDQETTETINELWGKAEKEYDLLKREAEIKAREAEIQRKEEERRAKELAEQQEKERVAREEQVRKEAEEKAKREAEEAIQREKEAKERAEREAKEAAIRAEKEKQEAIETERRRAAEKAERLEQERLAEIARKQEAEEKRKADIAHKEKIHSQANRFIRGILGTTEEQAAAIIDAIACGDVPHIHIKY